MGKGIERHRSRTRIEFRNRTMEEDVKDDAFASINTVAREKCCMINSKPLQKPTYLQLQCYSILSSSIFLTTLDIGLILIPILPIRETKTQIKWLAKFMARKWSSWYLNQGLIKSRDWALCQPQSTASGAAVLCVCTYFKLLHVN